MKKFFVLTALTLLSANASALDAPRPEDALKSAGEAAGTALDVTGKVVDQMVSVLDHEGRPHVLETDLSVAVGGMLHPSVDRTDEVSRSYLGPQLFVGAAYRSDYFLSPFAELGYFNIYSNELALADGSRARTSLTAFSLDAGADLDFWHLRLRAGGGFSALRLASDLGGARIRSGELDMTTFLSAAGTVYESGPWTARLEVRAQFILAAGVTLLSAGLTASYDAIHFDR